jgi:tight adherence protein B
MTGPGLDPATIAVFTVAALTGVGTLAAGYVLTGGRATKRFKTRLARAAGHPAHERRPAARQAAARTNVRLDQSGARMRRIDALAHRVLPNAQLLRDRLAKTGRRITLAQYTLVCLGIVLAVTLVRPLLFHMPGVLALPLALAAGVGLPHLAISLMIKRRLKRFTSQFAEAIDLIVRGLKSGLPTQESIRVVGQEFGDPIGVEFRRIHDSVRFGKSLEDAMWETTKRLDTPEFRFFVISLAVQRETGGNLAETLENLADILRKRRQMQLKVKAMSSEAKASAMILGSLPFIMFVILYLVNSSYASQLFQDRRGLIMLGAGLGSIMTGIAVMMKMVRFEI